MDPLHLLKRFIFEYRWLSKINLILFWGTVAIVLLSLGYQMSALSLWTDELVTAALIQRVKYFEFFTYWPGSTNLPFYYVVLKFFMSFFTANETYLRLPSVLAFFVSLVFVLKIGTRFEFKGNKSISILLGILFVYSNSMFLFAHEARPYALQVALLTVHLYYTWDYFWGEQDQRKAFIIILLLAPCCMLTHYYGALYLAVSVFLTLFLSYGGIQKRRIAQYWGAHSLCLLPIAYGLKDIYYSFLLADPFWISPLTRSYVLESLKNGVTDKGAVLFFLTIAPLIMLIFASVFSRSFFIKLIKDKSVISFVFFLSVLLVSLSVVMIKSYIGPSVLHSRYLAIWTPLFLLLVGFSLRLLNEIITENVITITAIVFVMLHWTILGANYFFELYPINDPQSAIEFSERYIETLKTQKSDKQIFVNTVLWNPSYYDFYTDRHPLVKENIKNEIPFYKIRTSTRETMKQWFPDEVYQQVIFIILEDEFYVWLKNHVSEYGSFILLEKDFSGIKVVILEQKQKSKIPLVSCSRSCDK